MDMERHALMSHSPVFLPETEVPPSKLMNVLSPMESETKVHGHFYSGISNCVEGKGEGKGEGKETTMVPIQ